MSFAEDRARELREQFELGEVVENVDLEAICAVFDIDLAFGEDLPAELPELYVDGRIALRKGLSEEEERWYIVHGLGHHVLHRGNRFHADTFVLAKKEREAELFAGHLLLGSSWPFHTPYDLAAMHTLPQTLIERWIALRDGRQAISAHWACV